MAVREDFAAKTDRLARAVAKESSAEVILYVGDLESSGATAMQRCSNGHQRPNVVLVLATFGGDAHAAYRIARCLRRRAKHFTVFVPAECKSAGTLLAIGADVLVMADAAELGPLDVQLRKPDEVGERSSGLTIMEALNTLRVSLGQPVHGALREPAPWQPIADHDQDGDGNRGKFDVRIDGPGLQPD